MLHDNIEGAGAGRLAIQLALLDGGQRGAAFKRLEAIRGHEKGAARHIQPVVGAAHPLQKTADAFRRGDLNDEIHITPVYAKLQSRSRDNAADFPRRHHGFGAPALLAAQRPVIDRNRQVFFIRVPQHLQHKFRLSSGIDEDNRCPALRGSHRRFRGPHSAP